MSDAQRVAVGIDVGGTFTDLAAVGRDGTIRTTKVLSQPLDRASGVIAAIREARLDGHGVAHIAHGTTVVTNLLLERAGARVVLCATEGFTDLLELRRQERAALYDLTRQHAAPLVSHEAVVGVHERAVPEGVLTPLEEASIEATVSAVGARTPETIAIAFLHAYAHPAHERALRDALERALPGVEVITSHETLPEIREYERTATTVAEAYARPAVRRYLGTLQQRLAEQGMPSPRVLTSAGGTLGAREASLHAASLALSGPAGGVTGAAAVVRALGIHDALTIDIGGTSADVGIVIGGEPLTERGGTIAGIPIAVPRVLVEAVAAGGGSIGWIDEGGALRAGPESAGALPGPAAYGRGGERPTVTDAHVVLGNVAEGEWSGGVTIRRESAERAMRGLADSLGVSVERAAAALLATADATMARALRRVSVERGINPRHVALVAFGGGGPLHACGLAERLGMTRIVIPPHAGVLSAVGLALAPERREGLTSLVARLDTLPGETIAALLESERLRLLSSNDDAQAAGEAHVANRDALEPKWWLRSRYQGQGHELDVPAVPGDDGAVLAERFVNAHRVRTGFTLDRPVECISVRTALVGAAWPVRFARPARGRAAEPASDVDDGAALQREVRGPAVIRLPDATLRIAPGWVGRANAIGGWLLEAT